MILRDDQPRTACPTDEELEALIKSVREELDK